jgi:hypothetical protein
MKFAKVTGTVAAFLLLGTAIPAFAQREGEGNKQEKGGQPQAHPAQPQQRQPQQAQPQHAQPQQPRAQQPQQQRQQQQPQRAQQPQPKQQAQPQRAQQPQQQRQEQQQQHVQQQPQQQQPQRAQQQQPSGQGRGQQPQRSQQQAQAWQQQRGWQRGGASQGHATFQQNRAQHWSSEHRTWAQRGGYGGYYIPQDRFGLYFGSRHFFRIGILPAMYLGYPRFSYGGFSFLLLDPYPENWAPNWYATDDVYIDYSDGYYLYDRNYPGVGLAVSIVL